MSTGDDIVPDGNDGNDGNDGGGGPEILTYERFGEGVRSLARSVVDSGYRPDWLVCVARGGLVVGGALGYALGMKNVATVNVEFYTGEDERPPVPVELPPALDPAVVATQRVLVVDDVADTGGTLDMVAAKFRDEVADLRTAVLYHKPRSTVAPDYAWLVTDAWIEFPWSIEPPVTSPRFG